MVASTIERLGTVVRLDVTQPSQAAFVLNRVMQESGDAKTFLVSESGLDFSSENPVQIVLLGFRVTIVFLINKAVYDSFIFRDTHSLSPVGAMDDG